ncbi:S8 family serine peptidase [Croceicoccus sp. Ery5]|uniref:subtilisin-like serine protease QhpE n=1 Tax=Croceicoccus sp. Ery5 TaxID=1703340 RepID=UPI001E3BBBA1|nr:S8 family serine peptidase [Croceicoccus sp. Ery5]
MADIRIAVIDSGVNPDHPHIDKTRIAPGIAIAGDGTLDAAPDAVMDRLGHGTAVTAAIQEKAPDALCMPVRIFHDSLRATGLALIAAIDWAAENGAHIVNLSLGSTNMGHAAAFGAAVDRAAMAGSIVVAPRAVDDAPCLPGALAGVIGVDVDWDCPRDSFRMREDAADGAEAALSASGYPRPIPGVPLQRNLYGTSFATAQISGFAARAMAVHGARDAAELRRALAAILPA